MARRNTRSTSTSTNEESNPTTEENAVSTATPEAEAPAPEQAPESDPPAESGPPAEADLTAFKAAMEAAVAEADTTTGEVPEASLAAVTKEYRALDGIKAKNAAKALANDGMKDQMAADNLAGARAYLNIGEHALVAAAGVSKGERVPADPTENFVQRVGTLRLAYGLAVNTVPEGVKDTWSEKVDTLVGEQTDNANSYFTWLQADPETRGEEPDVTAVVRNAAKLAQGKSAKAGVSRGGGTFTGERRDIGQHVMAAFEGKDVGTFLTIAEIRNTRSDEYGDNPPSAGAISARLFPKSGTSSMEKVGIKPDTQNGKKGAVLVTVEE